MNKEEVKRIIESNEWINEFIASPSGQLLCNVCGVPIWIHKEGVGASYHYKLSYDKSYNYQEVVDFMHWAIPVLSVIIENRRDEKIKVSDF